MLKNKICPQDSSHRRGGAMGKGGAKRRQRWREDSERTEMDIQREVTSTAWPGHRWKDRWVLTPKATCTRKVSWPSLVRRHKGGARARGAAVLPIHCTDTKSNSSNTRTYINPLRLTHTSAPMDRWVSWVLMASVQHLRAAPSSTNKEGTGAIPCQSPSTAAPNWGSSSLW